MFIAEVTYSNQKTKTVPNVKRVFLIGVKGERIPIEIPCEDFSPFPPGFSASKNFEIKGDFLIVTDTEELSFPLKTARRLTVRQS